MDSVAFAVAAPHLGVPAPASALAPVAVPVKNLRLGLPVTAEPQESVPTVSGLLVGGASLGLIAAASQRGRKHRHGARAARGAAVRVRAGGKIGCVGIVGCSGAVGQEMLKCLEARDFPTEKVRLFAKRSAGTKVQTKFGEVTIEPFSVEAAQECEVVLMAVSGDFSKEFSPKIRGGPMNTTVIDNSSAFRLDKDVPLVVPEINGGSNSQAPLIANPNCTTAIGAMALWPLHEKFKLKKVIMATYQAASGAGAEGMAELEDGLEAYFKDGAVSPNKVFAHQLPFNVIPQIDVFQTNGYTKEEMKVTWELQKIFGLPDDVKVSCTAVRVPTLRAHSESIVIETEKPINPEEARKVLSNVPGVKVVDDPAALTYPTPLAVTGQFDVEVGRIRQSIVFGDKGLEFFVSGDQLLRGAALNAVLIAEQNVTARVAA
jgi:aspartate-semialdehyde dehydrogenase